MSKYFVLLCCLMLYLASCQQNKPQSIVVPSTDLMANPENYANQDVCTEGTAVSGFEASVIAAGTIERDGAVYLTEPVIWLENVTPEGESDCFTTGLPPMTFCRVRVCGRFETDGGFGHLGGYDFQLVGSPVVTAVEPVLPLETVVTETAFPPQIASPPPNPTMLPEPTGRPGVWSSRATYASPGDPNAPQFNLEFDSAAWELLPPTANQPESHLSHRQLSSCTITPSAGMGLPDDWVVENSYETIDRVGYEVFRASQEGELRFVNYCTAVAESYTCFLVQIPLPECLQAAEVILGSMTATE